MDSRLPASVRASTVANVAVGGQFFAVGTYQVRLPDILPPDYRYQALGLFRILEP